MLTVNHIVFGKITQGKEGLEKFLKTLIRRQRNSKILRFFDYTYDLKISYSTAIFVIVKPSDSPNTIKNYLWLHKV